MAAELARCNPDTKRMTLEVEPFARRETSKAFSLTCVPPKYKDIETYTEPRPDKIAELEPGIFYVDLDRVDEANWKTVTPRLEKAKGIVFDMRGYPGRPGILALGHPTGTTIRCARWNVPEVTMPDRLNVGFNESGWDVKPEKPYFPARRAFPTDGRADGGHERERESVQAAGRLYRFLDRHEGAEARQIAASRHRHSAHCAGFAHQEGRGRGEG
jgi:hypothetical protein